MNSGEVMYLFPPILLVFGTLSYYLVCANQWVCILTVPYVVCEI